MTDTPTAGRTVQAHVDQLLEEAHVALVEVKAAAHGRLRRADRARLWRQLAGVVANCEKVRLWLDAGAQQ